MRAVFLISRSLVKEFFKITPKSTLEHKKKVIKICWTIWNTGVNRTGFSEPLFWLKLWTGMQLFIMQLMHRLTTDSSWDITVLKTPVDYMENGWNMNLFVQKCKLVEFKLASGIFPCCNFVCNFNVAAMPLFY